MSMITYPLNNVEYTAEDAELYNCTRTSGVYSGEDFSCTVSGTNNNVTIGEGVGWIRNSRFSGKVFANKAPVTLKLDIADAINPRIDIVAVRFDVATNTTDLVIKKGTAAANPVMPEIVQTEKVYELYLFGVYRETAATVITADNVTDLRLDASVCGLMADAVTSVDTSVINKQFTAYLEHIKKELADLKVDKIDAYTREETFSDFTKETFGFGADAVPDDALKVLANSQNRYFWEKLAYEETREDQTDYLIMYGAQNNSVSITYGDSYTFDNISGSLEIDNPETYSTTGKSFGDFYASLSGKYIASGSSLIYIPEDAVLTSTKQDTSTNTYFSYYSDRAVFIGHVQKSFGYYLTDSEDTYANDESMLCYGKLGAKPAIEWGQYVGTGTYGSDNRNSLTFNFNPKVVFIGGVAGTYNRGTAVFTYKSGDGAYEPSTNGYGVAVSWDKATVSWYSSAHSSKQYNESGRTYYYVAIGGGAL